MAESNNPELHRLLATLNGYSPSAQSNGFNESPHENSQASRNSETRFQSAQPSIIPGLGRLPPDPTPPARSPASPFHSSSNVQSSKVMNVNATRSNIPSTSSLIGSPTPNVPSASTITTWPAALKHVTKYLANDEKVSSRIRHLISEQQKHEQQWWEGREALLALHNSRSGTSAQVSALLRSLGGKDTLSAPRDPKANQAELDAYDAKVYKSLLSMNADFDRQLRAMSIPFFAIKHELVILEAGRERSDVTRGRLDKGELRELQKRMLQHLEDLFGD